MFAPPSRDDVAEVAKSLGFTVSVDEIELYQRYVVVQLEAIEEFLKFCNGDGPPQLTSASRGRGYRPSADQDPFNAWLWKCDIQGAASGLLAGKTVSFKDHVAVAGIPLTFGARAFEHFIPDFDATIVSRVLQSGGTIIGKNSLDGLTGPISLGRGDYRRPLNPHKPEHLTGWSSSGSAVALAAGDVDIAFGGDQGGSIRIPASWTGTVALKPTFGLVSHFGIGSASDPSIDFVGPMGRTVEDVAAALQAVAGYDDLDPRQGRDVPNRIEVLSNLDAGIKGLRIGILEEGISKPIQREVVDAVMAATEVLADAGAKLTTVSIPEHRQVSQIIPLYAEGGLAIFKTGLFGAFARTYYPTSLIVAMNRFWAYQADLLNPFTKLTHLVAEFSRRNHHGAVYAKAHNMRRAFIDAYDKALAQVDVLITPTCISVAPKFQPNANRTEGLEAEFSVLSRDEVDSDISGISVMKLAVRNTMQFNYTGHPALSVPCGKANGLPIGLQLIGRFFDDGLLLRVAAAYQHLATGTVYTEQRRGSP